MPVGTCAQRSSAGRSVDASRHLAGSRARQPIAALTGINSPISSANRPPVHQADKRKERASEGVYVLGCSTGSFGLAGPARSPISAQVIVRGTSCVSRRFARRPASNLPKRNGFVGRCSRRIARPLSRSPDGCSSTEASKDAKSNGCSNLAAARRPRRASPDLLESSYARQRQLSRCRPLILR
jgi:hypothetical protein